MPESDHRPPPGEVSRLLIEAGEGRADAFDRLFPLVYAELRRAARRQLAREQPGHTLQPTALVHEAYLKLAAAGDPGARSRAHFLAVASRAMRQILVDHARRRNALKRSPQHDAGGALQGRGDEPADLELLHLDAALEGLGNEQPRLRQVVECRFFGGLTEEETADALEVTARTVRRDWVRARAWLYRELYGED